MRTLPKILGACAILALAGSAAWAASGPAQHRLTVWLLGGGSEMIAYTGDVAPKVSITPSDFAPASFGSPFAWADAMPVGRAAAMDADMASMLRQADAMMAMPMPAFDGMSEANLDTMPAGSRSYSVISTINGNDICTRSVQIIRNGNGKPKMVRHSSGNCAAMPGNSVLSGERLAQDHRLMTVKSTAPAFAPAYPHI